MPHPNDHYRPGIDFDAEDTRESQLWDELGRIPVQAPPPSLRRSFFQRLDRSKSRRGWLRPLQLAAPAFATLVLGLLLGINWRGSDPRIEAMEQQLTELNQTVALALLRDDSASQRLRGVTLAASLQEARPELASALLQTAAADSSASVRNAAVQALGPRLSEPRIAAALQELLVDTSSVLVQLTIAEMILRWGSDSQIQSLLDAGEAGSLNPEVQRFVLERVRRVVA